MKKKLFPLVMALVLCLSAAGFAACQKAADPLIGSWQLDAATVYVFEKDGQGSMKLPLSQNPFTYSVEENVISIDFEDPAMADRSYTYAIEGDTLTMTVRSLTGDEDVTYTFTRLAK